MESESGNQNSFPYDEIYELVMRDTVEFPAPPEKPVEGPCVIPVGCIKNGVIDNKPTTVRFRKTRYLRHRLAAALPCGEIREDLDVLHDCDRKCCVAAKHLRYGTSSENVRDAIARKLLVTSPPSPMRGEESPHAKLAESHAREIKYLLANQDWHTAAMRERLSIVEAIAIYYDISTAAIRAIKRLGSWAHVDAKCPIRLPTIENFPEGCEPPPPYKRGKITKEDVVDILTNLPSSGNISKYISECADRLGVGRQTITNVIKGRSWSEVSPDLKRLQFYGNGNRILTDHQVQEIRATAKEYLRFKGLAAALARRYEVAISTITTIIDRVSRIGVPDDDSRAIPFEELELKELTQRGANHPLSKISDDQFMEMLAHFDEGKSLTWIALRFGVSLVCISRYKRDKNTRPHLRRLYEERKKRSPLNPPQSKDSPSEEEP